MSWRTASAPDSAISERLAQAHIIEVKEWIPNIIGAEHPEDIFTSSLERTVAQYIASLVNRKHGGDFDLSKVRKLADVTSRLEQLTKAKQGD